MQKSKLGNLSNYIGTFAALIILCIALALASPNFLDKANLMSILKQTSFNALLSTGMLLTLITAGIDLSVGATATFGACVAGAMVRMGVTNPIFLFLAVLVVGGVVGLINGLLLTRLHLPHPFVSTLGMKNVLWGAALIITSSQMISFSSRRHHGTGKCHHLRGIPYQLRSGNFDLHSYAYPSDKNCLRPFHLLCRRKYGGYPPFRYQCGQCINLLLCAFRLYGRFCRNRIHRTFRNL